MNGLVGSKTCPVASANRSGASTLSSLSVLSSTSNLGSASAGTGYFACNCLTILFEYKSTGKVADRDLLPEDSVYLTFSFRNLGDYVYQPRKLIGKLNDRINN